MFAKGPMPGTSTKAEALAVLPPGTQCTRQHAMGITGYVVALPDGRKVASAGNASQAWEKARDWALRQDQSSKGN